MTKLMEVSVYPESKEKQNVATFLWVFCKEMYTATNNHQDMRNVDEREHTATFIKIVVN